MMTNKAMISQDTLRKSERVTEIFTEEETESQTADETWEMTTVLPVIEEMNKNMYGISSANVRRGPGTDYESLGKITGYKTFLLTGRKEMKKKETQALGIYIHIPFCMKKCKYCDFLSFCGDDSEKKTYSSALVDEIKEWGRLYGKKGKNYPVSTIYFGGGTPSVLETIYIEEILQVIRAEFTVSEDGEITLECNPGTADDKKFSSYYRMGINRISMGLQSAHNEELKKIGRIHTWEDFLQCYEAARDAGFDNINLDVMSALPDQTWEMYQDTLQKVVDLKPEHVSSYSLIIEEGTPFFQMYEQGLLHLPDEDTERKMYYQTNEFLRQNGYHRYEISNYARPGYESRHNSSYWTRENYLGLGLGASSLIDNIRFRNTDRMMQYIGRNFKHCSDNTIEQILSQYEEVEMLSVKEQMEEFMFLGLRMTEGVSIALFEKTYGKKFHEVYGAVCEKLKKEGFIICESDRVRLTEQGIDVSNVVLAEFLLE